MSVLREALVCSNLLQKCQKSQPVFIDMVRNDKSRTAETESLNKTLKVMDYW